MRYLREVIARHGGWWRWLWYERLRIAFVLMFLTSMLTAYFGWDAQRDRDAAFRQFLEVSAERRDQNCTTDEREHADHVAALERTYMALQSPTIREQLGPGLVRFAVANLGQLERQARTDQAPAYCDEPGFGLPEPDPVPPERQDFSHLLAPSNGPP